MQENQDLKVFRVESGVPIPPRRRPKKYHWALLKPGDSVAFPIDQGWESAKVSAQKFFTAQGWEMTTRVLGKMGRIWRIK